ncbi:MAG: hypothetical protein V4615_07530, partial [Bacteroidota bacterium]
SPTCWTSSTQIPISRIRNDFFKEVANQRQTIFDENGENPQEFILEEEDAITLINIKVGEQVLPFNEMLELEFLIGVGTFFNSETGIYKVKKALCKMYYNHNLQFLSLDLFYDKLHQLQ